MEKVRSLLDSATSSGEYAAVGKLLDRAELESPELFDLPSWPYVDHMLGHMYAFDLEDARFVHKRIPSQVRDSDECVKATFIILQHLWNGDYQGVWHPLEATEWRGRSTVSMLESFKLVLRQRVMDLVERMYKDIEQTFLASLIGLDVDEACKIAKERHWVVEAATGLVVPITKSGEGATEQGLEWVGGRELERIAKYAIYLQSGQAPVSLNKSTL